MKFKRKIITAGILTLVLAICLICFQSFPSLMPLYNKYIFYPYQWLRGLLFGFLPFSLGDIIYIAGGIWLTVTLVKWLRYSIKFKRDKTLFGTSLLKTLNTLLIVYLLFLLGWGANYNKIPLRKSWGLDSMDATYKQMSKDELKSLRRKNLVAFDSFLVDRLNEYGPHYYSLTVKEINSRARKYYGLYTDSKLAHFGLGIKPTMFGFFLERTALEGYYNPFTGEGQVDYNQPAFTMPELVAHEIAHQAGIAAEGDANLMAYALCTASGDSTFQYSAYLNTWLYTNARLSYIDSALAEKFEAQLNKLTTAHIDTLEQLSKEYENEFAHYTGKVFDSYLKMQNQKDGVRGYGNVATSAWQLEQRRMRAGKELIVIP